MSAITALNIPVYNEGLNAFGAGYAPFPATAPTRIFGSGAAVL